MSSHIANALMGRGTLEESDALAPETERLLEALEGPLTEGKKEHLIDILKLALKMDSVNSMKHMVRRVLGSLSPDSMPKPPGQRKDEIDKDAAPEPAAKRPVTVKVQPPSAAPAMA